MPGKTEKNVVAQVVLIDSPDYKLYEGGSRNRPRKSLLLRLKNYKQSDLTRKKKILFLVHFNLPFQGDAFVFTKKF